MPDEMASLKKKSRKRLRWKNVAITSHKHVAEYFAATEHFMGYNTRIVHDKKTGKFMVQVFDGLAGVYLRVER